MNSQNALKQLRELVGDALYERILTELGGSTVYFPANGTPTEREERNLQIKDDYYSGNYEVSDLARKYDLSISRIYKIIQTR